MHPSYINSYGNTSFSAINQQSMTSFGYCNNEILNLETTNMQPTMENCSYNNRFNSHLNILENKCLKGKRSSQKDHHSKINTARGPRDRRIRLSRDVAKKFFKLQDMLGFDKPSNTIQWLLMNSKPAIQDLHPQKSYSPPSASECEVLSGIDNQSMDQVITTNNKNNSSCSSKKEKRYSILAKETREKARARARKRTAEKRNIKLGCDIAGCDQYSKLRPSVDQDQYTNWIPFGEDQVDLTDQAEYPSSHFGDNSSMMANDWSPFLFNCQHNLGPCNENQFSDFQILGKPWEDINN